MKKATKICRLYALLPDRNVLFLLKKPTIETNNTFIITFSHIRTGI